MTKSKKTRKANAVSKVARKTLGLMARVGDALEAVAVAVAPAPGTAGPGTSSSPAPREPAPLPAPREPASDLLVEALSIENAPGVVNPGAGAVASEAVDGGEGVRALAAIEVYATRHNLRAVDLPSRTLLVEILTRAMTHHGSKFTDAHVQSLLDEQMRIHFRTASARPRG
jgi:hypothetical protein